jgi:hypothetical protein
MGDLAAYAGERVNEPPTCIGTANRRTGRPTHLVSIPSKKSFSKIKVILGILEVRAQKA